MADTVGAVVAIHGTLMRVFVAPFPVLLGASDRQPRAARRLLCTLATALVLAAPVHAGAQRPQAPAPIEARQPAAVAPHTSAGDEGAIMEAINQLRAAESLAPLVSHPGLMDAARRHSVEMAQSQTLAHVSPTTGSPVDRAAAAGVRALRVTQNISRRSSAEAAHEAILASEAHRAQLLDPNATHIGLGIAIGADGVYLTELTARLAAEPSLPPPSVADVPQLPAALPPVAPAPVPADEPVAQAVSVPPHAPAQPTVAPPPPAGQPATGTLPTLRLTRSHRGVSGYWIFHEGRWWYFPVPAGSRTGQVLYPDTTVHGTPPGYQGTPPATAQPAPTRVQPTPVTAPRGYWRLTPQ